MFGLLLAKVAAEDLFKVFGSLDIPILFYEVLVYVVSILLDVFFGREYILNFDWNCNALFILIKSIIIADISKLL